MARLMQRKFGVVRNWKQCRTKYKNLKYDYKIAKSSHAAGGDGAGTPGKYMKFFDEVEAILLDQGLENGTTERQKKTYDGETGAESLQSMPQTGASESEIVIEIDDGRHSFPGARLCCVEKKNHFPQFWFQMTTAMIMTWMQTWKWNGQDQVCLQKQPVQLTACKIFQFLNPFFFFKHQMPNLSSKTHQTLSSST